MEISIWNKIELITLVTFFIISMSKEIAFDQLDIFSLEDLIWIATKSVGLPSYDFDFETFFACRRPWQRPDNIKAIGRFGVTAAYQSLYQEMTASGVTLIHTPEQYLLASELPRWYPLLEDLTPKSIWFESPPAVAEIEQHLKWPIFVRGSRQTSRHRREFSIVHSREEYQRVIEYFQQDPILHWQSLVCREYVSLRPVAAVQTDKIPPSFEFRTFWWKGQCVGFGPYWSAFASYHWNKDEERAALVIAGEAAKRVNLPFLVVDVAQTSEGKWIVIECNDGQESGYVGVSPIALWQQIIEIERG